MSVCTFFGHRECYGLDAQVLSNAIEAQIGQGVEEFLVGNQGQYDAMVRRCLKTLQLQYPHIRDRVVLAYLPGEKLEFEDDSDTMYPEGIEMVHPKFALDWRNRYLIDTADICLCYINQTWGGAYKFACMAKRRGRTVINLGCAAI